jgi:hypothetical protein
MSKKPEGPRSDSTDNPLQYVQEFNDLSIDLREHVDLRVRELRAKMRAQSGNHEEFEDLQTQERLRKTVLSEPGLLQILREEAENKKKKGRAWTGNNF